VSPPGGRFIKSVNEHQRLLAINKALNILKLLDEKVFFDVSNAIIKGPEGEPDFEVACEKGGVPSEMIGPLWRTLQFIEQDKAIDGIIDW
jgi:hypothetical protein